MSANTAMQLTRVVNELRQFTKKLLLEPSILSTALEIGRKYYGEPDMQAKIAQEISATTSVKIPDDPADYSDADKLFLELVKEVLDEEQALY